MKRLIPFLALVMVAACGGDDNNTPTGPTTPAPPYSQTDLVVGTGAPAVSGSQVTVAYTGWLYDATRPDSKGTQFDSNTSFSFRLGTGAVIRGWDQGVPGIRVGGQRRLVIPPDLAYGSAGRPPAIPGNSTLVFDITLNGVQ
ncbi:MAG TPA: FKBP-type peptidyl-prolyl cis-trans isomerase [Vicinamibacterales bacterium]